MSLKVSSLKRIIFTAPWAFLFITVASAAHSQSLADLAKQEKVHRSRITNERVITDEEAAKYITQSSGPDSSSDQTMAKVKPEKTDLAEPVDFSGRPESYWRKTMSDARQSVKELEAEKNVLILRQNRLENEFHRENDGFKRGNIQREIQKILYEQDLNRDNLEKAREALEDLKKEARKSGALPGWISGR